jgi:hypothetical protein
LCAAALLALTAALATPAAALQVLDHDGEPVAGAGVIVLKPARADNTLERLLPPIVSAVTGADGRLASPLPQLSRFLLLIDHEGHAPWVQAVTKGERLATVRLQPGRSWSLAVSANPPLTAAGHACAAWRQELSDWTGTEYTWKRCAPLPVAGPLVLDGLPATPLSVQLEVTAPGFLPLRTSTTLYASTPLQLTAGHLVRGRVEQADGTPLAGARVSSPEGEEAATDAGGWFQVAARALPTSLEARAAGFRSDRIELDKEHSEGPIVFRLQRGQQIAARLTTGDGPLEEVRVWVERIGDGVRDARQERLDLEDGAFELDLEEPGEYLLRFQAAGLRSLLRGPYWIAENERRELGTLVLDSGGVVEATLVDAGSAEPVAGAILEALPLGTPLLDALRRRDVGNGVSDGEGQLRLAGLEPGAYQLRLSHNRYGMWVQQVVIAENERLQLGTVSLDAGVSMTGSVTDRSGRPLPGVMVRVLDPAGESLIAIAETVADRRGEFRGPRLAAGSYGLQVLDPRVLLAQEVELTAGEEEVYLDLVVSGVDLAGLVSRGGVPVSGGHAVSDAGSRPWRAARKAGAGVPGCAACGRLRPAHLGAENRGR